MFVSGMGKTATYIRYSFEKKKNIYIYIHMHIYVPGFRGPPLVHLDLKKMVFMKGCSHRPALWLDDSTMPAAKKDTYVIGNQMEGISSTKGSSNCHHYREQPDFASASGKTLPPRNRRK